jgi:hypothetical protein
MNAGPALKAHCADKLAEAEEKVEMIRAQEGRATAPPRRRGCELSRTAAGMRRWSRRG